MTLEDRRVPVKHVHKAHKQANDCQK